jgi:hypothetical protein
MRPRLAVAVIPAALVAWLGLVGGALARFRSTR